jgi:hypothetical protein
MRTFCLKPEHESALVCLLILLAFEFCAIGQCVEIRAQIETERWWPTGVNVTESVNRIVVATNAWLIETEKLGQKWIRCFTGTNMILHNLTTGYPTKFPELYERNHPDQIGSIGRHTTTVVDSDGSFRAKTTDFPFWSGFDVKGSWFAFCSGTFLKRPQRQIPLPQPDIFGLFSPASVARPPFLDRTTTFPDALGLPASIDLLTTNYETVLQYRAQPIAWSPNDWDPEKGATNVLGWTFPLQFRLAQYRSTTNGCELDWVARGRVISIGEVRALTLPPSVDLSDPKVLTH